MPTVRRQTLTKQMVETAKPTKRAYRLWDAKVVGLALRVLPSGRRTYEAHWARGKAVALGTAGVMTLESAREAARRLLGEVAEHGAPLSASQAARTAAGPLTFGVYLSDHYGPHIEATHKAGAATRANLKAQFGYLGDRLLTDITRADFDQFKARRLRSGIKPVTVNRDLDRLKAALAKAVEWGNLESNPLQGQKRITRDIEERVRYLSKEEEPALRTALADRETRRRQERASGEQWRQTRHKAPLGGFGAYTDHLMPMALLALNTGMRRGELTQLRWSDIDLPGARLTVRAGYAKSGKARHIPLNREALSVLKALRADQEGQGRLFPVGSIAKAWDKVVADAKIEDFHFHDLRHTFASKLVMAGVDLNTVRELLGHGDIKMTLRYAHLAPEHKAAAVELLAG
jgi:integrase